VAWKRMQAKLYSERGMHEKAALKIREALAIDTQNANEIKGYQRNGELVRDYLDILESGKLYAQLFTETQNVLSTDKAMAEKGWWIYVKRAVAKRYLDQKQGAMADFEKAIEIVQTDKDANQDVLIAIIDKIRLTLDPAAAIERARKLAEAGGPQAVRWKIVLAYLYYQDSQNDQATRLIEEARKQSDKLDERNVQSALSVGGTIFMMTGDFEKAKAWYEDLLTKKPDDLPALNNLACIEAEHQTPPNMTKAMEYSQRALDAMTKKGINDANVLDTYGWVNVLAGDATLDRGIDYLNNSIKAGEIAEANYHLGKAYMKKKIPDAAKSSFTKAAQMLQDRKEKGEPVDQALKKKIEDALVEVEGIVGGGPRAGNP
jgi:tetratricopeptide (TPR) repeat protein